MLQIISIGIINEYFNRYVQCLYISKYIQNQQN